MVIEAVLTFDDFVAAQKEHRRASSKWRAIIIYGILLSVVFAISATNINEWQEPNFYLLPAFPLVFLLSAPVLNRWGWYQLWKQDPARGQPLRYLLNEIGIEIIAPESETTIKWQRFIRLRLGRETMLLYLTANSFLYLPHRVFASKEDLYRVQDLFQRRVAAVPHGFPVVQ